MERWCAVMTVGVMMMLRGILELTDVCCDTDSLSLSLHPIHFFVSTYKMVIYIMVLLFPHTPCLSAAPSLLDNKAGRLHRTSSFTTDKRHRNQRLLATNNHRPQTYKYTRSFDFNYVVNQFPGRRRCLRQDSQSNPNQSIPESPPRVHGEPPRQRVPFKPSVLRRRSFHRDSRVHLEVDE